MGIFDRTGDKKDKPKADFSNVQAGSSSTAPAGSPASTGVQSYVVVKGDSLSKIAKAHYGNADAWHKIYEANRDIIKDPDLIYPGQKLTIPAA